MIKFVGNLIHILAICMLLAGAAVASQKPIGASEVLLMSAALLILAGIIKSIGETVEHHNSKKSALPGPDKL